MYVIHMLCVVAVYFIAIYYAPAPPMNENNGRPKNDHFWKFAAQKIIKLEKVALPLKAARPANRFQLYTKSVAAAYQMSTKSSNARLTMIQRSFTVPFWFYPGLFSRAEWPNNTTFVDDTGQLALPAYLQQFRYIALLWNECDSEGGRKSKISHFWPLP